MYTFINHAVDFEFHGKSTGPVKQAVVASQGDTFISLFGCQITTTRPFETKMRRPTKLLLLELENTAFVRFQ